MLTITRSPVSVPPRPWHSRRHQCGHEVYWLGSSGTVLDIRLAGIFCEIQCAIPMGVPGDRTGLVYGNDTDLPVLPVRPTLNLSSNPPHLIADDTGSAYLRRT